MELNNKEYNRELLKKYSEELVKYQNNDASPDFEMIHYCINKVIMESDYLDELLDAYIYCGENEKLGYNDNIRGDALKDYNNIKNYSNELAVVYYGLRVALETKIIFKLKEVSKEEKEIFDEMMKKEYKNAVLEGKKCDEEINYLIDNANYKFLLESRMVNQNLSRQKADLQLAYDTNHACEEFVRCNAKKEALTLLMSKIKEFNIDEEQTEDKNSALKK